jgi:hypothetical protein
VHAGAEIYWLATHESLSHLLATITALPRTARPFLRVLGLYMPMMSRSTDSLDANASTDLRALPCCRAQTAHSTVAEDPVSKVKMSVSHVQAPSSYSLLAALLKLLQARLKLLQARLKLLQARLRE